MRNRSQVQKPEKQPAEQCPDAEKPEQVVWGMLLTYNLIRREAIKAAEKHKKAVSEISVKFAFRFIAGEHPGFCVTLKILQRHHIIQSPFKVNG